MTPHRERDPYHLRGFSQLALDATLGLTDLVEAMHGDIARPTSLVRRAPPARAPGLSGLVYRGVRWIARRVGGGLDATFATLAPLLAEPGSSPRREAIVAALNGVLGDHLAATSNPLAIPFELRSEGRALPQDAVALAQAVPEAKGRVVVLVHGLCCSDLHWRRRGHDHGAALARDLGASAIYARFNSGLHVSENGRAFAEALETMVRNWPVPVERLEIVAHSLGGLVARSACHFAEGAGHAWRARLGHLVCLGTPHHGAPLERGGQWLHRILGAAPYARALARLGRIRSAGITDLRHGNLLEEDWRDRDRFAPEGDRRQPVPLPAGVVSCAAAALSGRRSGRLRAATVGDGLVPLDSALGRHADPSRALDFAPERLWIGRGLGHLDLLDRPAVYERIRAWLDD